MPILSRAVDAPAAPRASGAFQRRVDGEGVLYTVHPARPPLAFRAAALLLAGLFGLPALGVLLSPSRHDGVSLLAAAGGLGIAGLAAWALLRGRRARRVQRFRLRPGGVEREGRFLPWPAGAALRVARPEAGPYARGASGIHGLAARIAAQQHAAEACLFLDGGEGGPALLASGLDLPTAEALREALSSDRLSARPPQ